MNAPKPPTGPPGASNPCRRATMPLPGGTRDFPAGWGCHQSGAAETGSAGGAGPGRAPGAGHARRARPGHIPAGRPAGSGGLRRRDGRRPGRGARADRRKPATGDGTRSVRLAEVARGGTLNLVGAAVAAVMTVGLTVVVTRHFSKYAAGSFFAATSAFLIVEMIATLGVQNGLVYFIARFRSLGEQARIPAVLRSALIPVTVVSVALAAVMLVFAGPLAHLLLNYHKVSGSRGSVDRSRSRSAGSRSWSRSARSRPRCSAPPGATTTCGPPWWSTGWASRPRSCSRCLSR